jgi:hypothetical protein
MVIKEYIRNNRNISAHNYREMPNDAAQTFIRRTYEIIQRLELMILDSPAMNNEPSANQKLIKR